MKNIICILLFFISSLLYSQSSRETLYQVSTIDALIQGVFDGNNTLSEVLQHGDFGIGTFNKLDGEMLLLDSKFYQITSTGQINEVEGSLKTPYAAVTFFDQDLKFGIENETEMKDLELLIKSKLPSENLFYAIKITGDFNFVKTRSVPAQTYPYPKLTEIVKTQPVFSLDNISGTLVGLRCSKYISGINVPGYHFHFLSEDKKMGGHILGFSVKKALVEIDITSNFQVALPDNQEFLQADLTGNIEAEIKKVEKENSK